MSIEQTDVVDIISTERVTGYVVLTISDHLDWSDSMAHQLLLAFVESGEVLTAYPSAKDSRIVFSVVFQYPPDESGRAFLAKARQVIESAGFTLRDEVFTGARWN